MNPKHAPKKRFGQHFLHDPRVIERIVQSLNPAPDDTIVEIGPGQGAITGPILDRCKSLTVIEIDRDVVAHLSETCRGRGELNIIQADALKIEIASLAKPGSLLRMVGNLPYNISTPLLFHLLAQADQIQDMTFMLQKEVVDRMCAIPNDDAYGRLSVSLAARAQVEYLFHVGPGAFNPPPRVDSAVVRVVPRAPEFHIQSWPCFDKVVEAAFGQRRKKIGNSLKALVNAAHFEMAGIDASKRAENLSAAEFARLANCLSDDLQNPWPPAGPGKSGDRDGRPGHD